MSLTRRPRRMLRRFRIRLRLGSRRALEAALVPLEPTLARIDRRLGAERVLTVYRDLPDEAHGPRILVPVSNPQNAAHLARMAAAVARTRRGVVVVAYVERVSPGEVHPAEDDAVEGLDAERWPAIAEALRAIEELGVEAGFVVLRAADVGLALRRSARRLGVEVIVLGWRGKPDDRVSEEQRLPAPLRAVLEYPPAEVMVVGGHGEFVPRKLLVPLVKGRDSRIALELARGFAEPDGHVTALKVVGPSARLNQIEGAARRLREELELYDAAGMGQLVIRAENRAEGVLESIRRGYDGVVMNAPQEPLLERLLFGQTQMRVASASEVPVIVVKGRSTELVYLGRRLWRLAYDRLPKLDAEERDRVEQDIRSAASPRVDFFVMIGLSSAIAGFGLLLNSPAVIIGAMLVAPLMAAIIGVGLGVVEGDLSLIRRAGSAAARGALLALAVGAALGMLRAGMDPVPSEILSRTRPNLLDLGVALASGAAGAYAIARKDVSASLAGVAIAAALVPPLVSAGIGLPLRRPDVFLGALLLYLTNFVAIAAAGGVMMLLLGFGPSVEDEEERRVLWRGVQTVAALLMVVTMSLGFLTYQTFRLAGDARTEQAVERIVRSEVDSWSFATLDDLHVAVPADASRPLELELRLKTPAAVAAKFDYELAGQLRDAIEAELGRGVSLELVLLPTRRIEPALRGMKDATADIATEPEASATADTR